ncbi:sigma-70 family RNA polymerase sigma factor [Nakamurella silvestris]|nr:sigma-70 family RNA polymerase sigma factor [Nakamurella silvestris]
MPRSGTRWCRGSWPSTSWVRGRGSCPRSSAETSLFPRTMFVLAHVTTCARSKNVRGNRGFAGRQSVSGARLVVAGMDRRGGATGVDRAGPESTARAIREQLPWMLSVSRALTGSRDTAETLVQDTVVRALPHVERWIDSPRPYLRRTMTNLHIDDLRRRRLIEFVPEPERHDSRSDTIGDVDLRLDIARNLELMPPLLRLVLIHRFLEDLSTGQVAELIGQTPGSVRRLTHQGLTLLRRSSLGAAAPSLSESDLR